MNKPGPGRPKTKTYSAADSPQVIGNRIAALNKRIAEEERGTEKLSILKEVKQLEKIRLQQAKMRAKVPNVIKAYKRREAQAAIARKAIAEKKRVEREIASGVRKEKLAAQIWAREPQGLLHDPLRFKPGRTYRWHAMGGWALVSPVLMRLTGTLKGDLCRLSRHMRDVNVWNGERWLSIGIREIWQWRPEAEFASAAAAVPSTQVSPDANKPISVEQQAPESPQTPDYTHARSAIADFRDLRISLAELEERISGYVVFLRPDYDGKIYHVASKIPAEMLPPLTQNALRIAMQRLAADPSQRLEWLTVCEKLLTPHWEIRPLITKEIVHARQQSGKW